MRSAVSGWARYDVADYWTGLSNDAFDRRRAHPDRFFAGMGARLTNPDGVQGWVKAGNFLSQGGTVTIDHIDENRIKGRFDVDLRAFVTLDGPAENFQFPRRNGHGLLLRAVRTQPEPGNESPKSSTPP